MLKHRARAVFLVLIAAAIGYFVYSTERSQSKPFRLGLDLSGGSHLVFRADVSKLAPADIGDSMAALRDDVERRVNTFGVSEPLVQTEQAAALSSKESAYKLIVELPGVTDPDKAAAAIGATPELDFRLGASGDVQAYFSSSTPLSPLKSTTTALSATSTYESIFKPTGLNGSMIGRASLQFDQTTGAPQVGLTFTGEGRALFNQLTKEHVGDFIGIFLDGHLIEAPVVREQIPNGQAVVSGSFTLDQAQTLVRNINFGALPVPIALISTQTVGPSLGQAAVQGGLVSGVVAFILIALFLIIWYRLPGVVAVVALGVYTVLMLAIFKIMSVTLTAAGIAGFIITIGMAVDANILIFERMKEELNRGRGIWDAMHEGFARAWLSIRDSNISSIITAIILFMVPSNSIVKGFALVFGIGVVVSMFTAITASRLFLFAISPATTTALSRFLIGNGFRRQRPANQS
ncbi:MAG: preprotein translocase subunit SecD [Candidatus Parcubacteria bacterium]|jgi:protein-export membrane protein SecD|nr:preprotein translocase subunit SecD [Candidatus Parcubacteria bacterium]